MKKQLIQMLTIAALFGVPSTLITGCAIVHHQETAGEYGSDARITTKVKTDLYKDPDVKGTEVNVHTMDGVVQLSGFVDNEHEKFRAEQIARSVRGVVDVHNDLILPTGR